MTGQGTVGNGGDDAGGGRQREGSKVASRLRSSQ